MPKATITDITNAGFRAEQFGSPADWLTASTGYVAVELARAGRWVEARIGATAYAAATAGTYLFDLLVQGDLSKLSDDQKVEYYRRVCESLGLNPLTRPFEYLTFQVDAPMQLLHRLDLLWYHHQQCLNFE